jgi:iron(III) transport system substrate-binding protein
MRGLYRHLPKVVRPGASRPGSVAFPASERGGRTRKEAERMRWRLAATSILVIGIVAAACSGTGNRAVVVYTSVDQPFSEPILDQFEEETGIEVQAVYDTEATKTTGLVSRLLAERDRPQADVFWSSEIAQTLSLTEEGILASYDSPEAAGIPAEFRDPESRWTGIGYRARILLVNTDLMVPGEYPASIFDLTDDDLSGDQKAIANPLFGTTATHAAVLYAALGAERAQSFFQDLADRGVRVVDGNSVVRDMVVAGEIHYGMTDTDDAQIAIDAGEPVEIVFPDQEGMGTLLIPNSVALVADGPNPEQARALIDYLVSRELERSLVDDGFFYGSLRDIGGEQLRAVVVSWPEVAGATEQAKEDVQSVLLR